MDIRVGYVCWIGKWIFYPIMNCLRVVNSKGSYFVNMSRIYVCWTTSVSKQKAGTRAHLPMGSHYAVLNAPIHLIRLNKPLVTLIPSFCFYLLLYLCISFSPFSPLLSYPFYTCTFSQRFSVLVLYIRTLCVCC